MDYFNLIGAIAGGLGIGSLLTTWINGRYDRKKFFYRERSTVYAGYLEALSNAVLHSSESNRQKVVYWASRLQLVAPQEINDLAMAFFRVKDGKDRNAEFVKLRQSIIERMARDLRSIL